MADMNVVPYIDVMLVLLVIFMVTAPMMQSGVELDLPNADVYIRADKEVAYGFLMQAMAAAQKSGATNIGLMADPEALNN